LNAPLSAVEHVQVCTVLPTYNERANITPLIDGIMQGAITPHRVLVVDDDSPDGTWQVVEALAGQRAGQVVLIRRREAKGLTSAIQHGIDEAIGSYDADIVTWMDCDLSMPPEDIPRLVRAILEGGADVAIGSRWTPGGDDKAHGWMPRTLSWILNHWAMLLLGRQVHDYTSGFVAARAEVLRRVRLQGDYGEYCIDFLYRAGQLGYRVREIPVICVPRASGESKTGVDLWDYLAKGRHYLATIWRLRFHG